MATGVSSTDRARIINSLCEMFPHMDRETVTLVLHQSQFHTHKAADILADMSFANTTTRPVKQQQIERKNFVDPNKYNQMVAFIKRGYKIMILMRGLPGSGKSTLAAQILYDGLGQQNRDEFIFSTDGYFWKSGRYIYKVQELQEAHNWNHRQCYASMKRGVSPIIIDNTNAEIWEMKAYCLMAVQFGYMIEVTESCTPWAYNIGILVQKNSHGVEKQKIKQMLDHFKKNVTVRMLFEEFKLEYKSKLPQMREYPALPAFKSVTPSAPSASSRVPQRVYSSPSKQFPQEYVHKFEMKHGESVDSTNKNFKQNFNPLTSTSTKPNYDEFMLIEDDTVDKLISIEDKKCNTAESDDLITFINEHKPPPLSEESVNSKQIDQIAKELQESKEMMAKIWDFIQTKTPAMQAEPHSTSTNEENISSTTENKMEVSYGSSSEFGGKNTDTNPTTTIEDDSNKNMEDLEEENKKLWDMLLKTKTVDTTAEPERKNVLTPNNFSTLKSTGEPSTSTAKRGNSEERMNMSTSNKSSPDDFEFIDMEWQKKTDKSSWPKFDPKAWGLSEETHVPWEITSPPPFTLPTPRVLTEYVETKEQATSTTLDESSRHKSELLKQQNDQNPTKRTEKIIEKKYRKKVTFDKGSMTDEDEILTKLDDPIRKLAEVFPNIPSDSLTDIYEKCGKDFYWTVDLLSNSPDFQIASTQTDQKVENKSPENSFKFNINDWNLTPSREEGEDEAKGDEDIAKKLEEEENQKLKKQELLQLKKQLETSVNISKEHYSDHLWQIKNAKKKGGKPESPETEMMNVDDDVVYVSDDSGDGSSENDDYAENFVEINLGKDLVSQLESMFGQLMPGDNFQPIVQMPESFARQLHSLYIESICKQIEIQSDHIMSQLKEDEEFARKLQEEDRKSLGNKMDEIMDEELAMSLHRRDAENRKSLTPETLALKLTKQKLHEAFPTIPHKVLDELLAAHDNNYKETVDTLLNSTGEAHVNPASKQDLLQPPISENTLSEMKMQEEYIKQVIDNDEGELRTAMYYRDEANKLMERRRELMNKAREYGQKHGYEVALYYSNLAEKALKQAEVANQHAAERFIYENSMKLQNGDTLDLHYLFVKSALATLDVFIDYQISNLKSANKPHHYFYVITGRGNHSENRKSKLKPAVIRRLKKRGVSHVQENPGMLKIKILKNLPMSSDLERPSN